MKYYVKMYYEEELDLFCKCIRANISIMLNRQFMRLRVNPNSLSYPFLLPLPLSFVRLRESKGCPNSGFDRGVGVRGRGR